MSSTEEIATCLAYCRKRTAELFPGIAINVRCVEYDMEGLHLEISIPIIQTGVSIPDDMTSKLKDAGFSRVCLIVSYNI